MKSNEPNPGSIQTLPILHVHDKYVELGIEGNMVILKTLTTELEVGQEIEVFTYYDENRELVATRQLPALQKGQVGCFRVTNSNAMGAFIDIGSKRDILIPEREQIQTLEKGKMVLVILLEDRVNKRLYATTKLQRHLRNEGMHFKRGDEVQMIIAEKIDAGRRVVVEGRYIGFLFEQEMTDRVRLGEKVKGYVRKCEFGELTVSMQREGMELLEDAKKKILQYLELNGGYVRLNDDTPPEEIKLRLHMSKKTFKKAAGMLFQEGKVTLAKFGIKLGGTPIESRDSQDEVKGKSWGRPQDEKSITSNSKNPFSSDTQQRSGDKRVLKTVSDSAGTGSAVKRNFRYDDGGKPKVAPGREKRNDERKPEGRSFTGKKFSSVSTENKQRKGSGSNFKRRGSN